MRITEATTRELIETSSEDDYTSKNKFPKFCDWWSCHY